jgi:hypothetical protein
MGAHPLSVKFSERTNGRREKINSLVLLLAGFFIGLFFHSEVGGSTFLQNVGGFCYRPLTARCPRAVLSPPLLGPVIVDYATFLSFPSLIVVIVHCLLLRPSFLGQKIKVLRGGPGAVQAPVTNVTCWKTE